MDRSVAVISAEGEERELPLEEAVNGLRSDANTVVVGFQDRADLEVGVQVLSRLPRLIAVAKTERRERRIEAMIETFLDVDPFDPVEAKIDADNAEMRAEFLAAYPVIESAAIHARAGHQGRNTAQTAAAWKRSGRIFSLPCQGRDVFPVFQFDADGQPLPLLKEVLAALPADLSPWQRAFWLVSPADELEGRPPIDLIKASEAQVTLAAREAGRLPIG